MKEKLMMAVLLLAIIFLTVGIIGAWEYCSYTSNHDTTTANRISEELGIDVQTGSKVSGYDSHGGFSGDGDSCVAWHFSDDKTLEQIKGNSRWKAFPLDETVKTLVYGVSDKASASGPYVVDEEGNPLVPKIQEGYYLLIDRHEDAEKSNILDESRYSYNFTVALYDTESDTLYYCRADS